MRLLLIRHGDPNYVLDCLTEKGRREAALLAEDIDKWNVGTVYLSPMRRAQQTASFSLRKLNIRAETLPWLREFDHSVDVNDCPELIEAYPTNRLNPLTGKYVLRIPWDLLPRYKAEHPELYDKEGWRHSDIAAHSGITENYDYLISHFDALLKENGYERWKSIYKVNQRNEETITFFCHLGMTNAILSHLFNVSPFALWDNICFPSCAITELVTEEREEGYANFKAVRIGESAHLLNADEPFGTSAMFPSSYYVKE